MTPTQGEAPVLRVQGEAGAEGWEQRGSPERDRGVGTDRDRDSRDRDTGRSVASSMSRCWFSSLLRFLTLKSIRHENTDRRRRRRNEAKLVQLK